MERYKTRMRFTKTGNVRFIGHLDLMRFFQKAVRRAGLKVAYSQGYSPHQLMSFASPLGVGQTTDGDYIDIEFEPDEAEPQIIMERLNSVLTDEVFITGIEKMPEGFKNSMALLKSAAYMITAKPKAINKDESDSRNRQTNNKSGNNGVFFSGYEQKFEDFYDQNEIIVTKKTKKSERTIDLKPAIQAHAYTIEDFEAAIGEKLPTLHPIYTGESIFMKLSAGSSDNVNPAQVMDAFFTFAGVEAEPFSYQIHRCQMWF